MERFVYEAAGEEGTAALGAALAELLPDGTTVALCGTLGAGKTRLVQAVAAGCGVDRRDVVSPTFVLIHEYQGRRPVVHMDAYRVRDADEFLDLGPEEYFDGPGLVLVEWADRVESCLPRDRIEIHVEVTGAQTRRFEILATTPQYDAVFERLREKLNDTP
jgi:tRNA threonylcarbamoyladenosine biosynthesis protein TsaE